LLQIDLIDIIDLFFHVYIFEIIMIKFSQKYCIFKNSFKTVLQTRKITSNTANKSRSLRTCICLRIYVFTNFTFKITCVCYISILYRNILWSDCEEDEGLITTTLDERWMNEKE